MDLVEVVILLDQFERFFDSPPLREQTAGLKYQFASVGPRLDAFEAERESSLVVASFLSLLRTFDNVCHGPAEGVFGLAQRLVVKIFPVRESHDSPRPSGCPPKLPKPTGLERPPPTRGASA